MNLAEALGVVESKSIAVTIKADYGDNTVAEWKSEATSERVAVAVGAIVLDEYPFVALASVKLSDQELEVLEECAEVYCNERDPRVITIRGIIRRLG